MGWRAAPGLKVLDVGAGAAPWSLAIAARDPACCVTALDLPAVISVTKRAVAAAGLGGLEAMLLAWNRVYETVRLHQALDYLAPDEFYHRWLAIQTRKETG